VIVARADAEQWGRRQNVNLTGDIKFDLAVINVARRREGLPLFQVSDRLRPEGWE
jgi:hypothetical protein